ncbi:P-II family nitrogen regulator [Propionibacterium australiense]|uniref:Nitrogen regulatory protein P-II n=1 Tax=Propionibacterium australiense TaxID=119981 RepID=A0A383S7L2_9ACTN|nr:P-II family nitrogen regulator [Propionibacterium australiense]RLP09751.1 P-II family nitrogen regulator [Propionibacterium australiense]RLP10194.1 P-II family nitrogen regulator [Propionibacterium australiense]SYZ33226.1 Nitrogen regulatory protein P-II [Propionibacterium australiense]VEH89286.1 Nitrogen regulatory protein P-II [Propionibacterium australiense]
MKLITAIVQPSALEDIEVALARAGVHGMTVSEVSGYGAQRGHIEVYRGAEYMIDFIAKVRVEVLSDDHDAESVIATICEAAHTGNVGDGKVWSCPVEEVVRIRTGERGVGAI